MNSLRPAAAPRVLPRPLGSIRDPAGQLRSRSVRIIRRGAVTALRAHWPRGPDPALASDLPKESDRIRSRGIPCTARRASKPPW